MPVPRSAWPWVGTGWSLLSAFACNMTASRPSYSASFYRVVSLRISLLNTVQLTKQPSRVPASRKPSIRIVPVGAAGAQPRTTVFGSFREPSDSAEGGSARRLGRLVGMASHASMQQEQEG